jgi:hypothetical protein
LKESDTQGFALSHQGAAMGRRRSRYNDAFCPRRQEREAMGQDVLNGTGFIGISGNSMMIHFPRKRGPFHFNNPRNPDAESRRQKVGRLKDFEICASLRRNYRTMGKKLSTHSTRSFARSKNEVLAQASDRISTTVLDWCLSKYRVRLEVINK